MAKKNSPSRSFLRMSLATRVTIMLIFASLLPLLILVISSDLQTRPVLTNQASKTLQTDAQTHVQLIEQFFHEQFALAATVGQNPTIQEFLQGQKARSSDALNVLVEIYRTNVHFNGCALFDSQGHLLLASPTVPQKHGQYLFPPDDLHQIITQPLTLVSPVFYNQTNNQESVDLYVPVQTSFAKVLGIVRITLSIDYIQEIVTGERGANGSGSYAFLLDQFGVRIADSDPTQRFSAITSLNAQTQQRIQNEAIYGDTGKLQVQNDPTLTAIQQSAHPPLLFQIQPTGQQEPFQATRISLSGVPWTYFVLAPLRVITAVADQQLQTTLEIAFLVLILAIGLGLLVGRGLTRPLLSAVDALNTNTTTLTVLAEKQQRMATEEQWIVDASQGGLHQINYYTEATDTAAQTLRTLNTSLLKEWRHMEPNAVQGKLQQMFAATQYIKKAVDHQQSSKEKFTAAIRVMKQVNEQLATGATAANNAASQEEKVVKQLQNIVK